MRFNLEIGPGGNRLADVTIFGRLANVSIWTGDPVQAAESKYLLQFNDEWAKKIELEKCRDAIRVAVADVLESDFDPALIRLIVESDSPRWAGRIIGIPGPQ